MGLRTALGLVTACLTATLVLAAVLTLPAQGVQPNHPIIGLTDAHVSVSELPPLGAARIVLYGDSLVSEAGQDFSVMAQLSGASVRVHTFPGTAPCDFFATMAADAQDWRPTVAMLAFSGDAFTPCMAGVQVGGSQYFTKYEHDTQAAISTFRSVGAKVILVGLPPDASASLNQNASLLNHMYQSLAESNPGVTYDDAGEAVTASGQFTWTLPCLPREPCAGPNGTNVIRAPDGVHFCPTGGTTLVAGFEECDVYSSGAFRFAAAMLASALTSGGVSKADSSPSATCRSEPVDMRRMTVRSKPRRASLKECRARRGSIPRE